MKKYVSANDYLNLFTICIFLLLVCQFTVRIFILTEPMLILLKFASALLLIMGVLFLVLSIKTFISRKAELTEEEAYQVLERYVREHKFSNKEEDIITVKAIETLLTLRQKGD